MSNPAYTLGLDLGANSIGWALLDEPNQRILASGVRVFPEGVDNFDTKKEKSKSEARRVSRGMRRQINRRARRKRRLREALVGAGLYPDAASEQQRLCSLNPYKLRRKALDERLELNEIGRVLLNLAARRGFLSNRKSDREKKSEMKGMLAEINQLAADMQASGDRTLGEHFSKALANDPLARIRGHHTRRDMLENEFNQIWEAQRKFHPNKLTERLKYGELGEKPNPREPLPLANGRSLLETVGIFGLIFFQRPMYWPKSVVGECELEKNKKRCPRADRVAQRFRLLQEVNNLRYLDPESGQELPLSNEQRTLLLDKLSKAKEGTFDQIRKWLGFIDSIAFNLERGKRKKLQGKVTDAILASKELFGPAWHKRPEAEKNAIARALIHADEREIRQRAASEWQLAPDAVERLLDVELPAGYANLSLIALDKLLPHMEQGLLYMSGDGSPCALTKAGYLRPDQIKRTVLDKLPEPPHVTNPVVRQALYELRKVVNAIIARYGKPARIHIELARNATASAKERSEMSTRMREREADRDRAADKVREHGAKVTRDAIDRYLLWEEQGLECVYSGKPISINQLLGGEVHIDHILPYSRCLDDSFANKVLCFESANKGKANQTPYEWLAERNPKQFEEVRQRAAKLPYNKRRKFTQKELELDKFIERQLNDTRYISRAAVDYLRHLVEEPHHVLCPKGSHTEHFRWLWGLNSILHEEKQNRKSRTDHRHHAIDAIVVALLDQKRLNALAQATQYDAPSITPEKLAEPWKTFRTDVEAKIHAINVSHRVRRKVAGALHKVTRYGVTTENHTFVCRKPLEELTPAMIDDIRDNVIKLLVIDRLREHGISIGRGTTTKIPKEVWKVPLRMNSGVEIKRVRVLQRGTSYRTICHRTAVELATNHHMEIFEEIDGSGSPLLDKNGQAKRIGIIVPMLEASRRVIRSQRQFLDEIQSLDKQPLPTEIIQDRVREASRNASKQHPIIERNASRKHRFVMSLSINEMLLLEMDDGSSVLHRVQKMSDGVIILRPHTYAGKVSDSDKPPIIQRKSPNTLRGRKVVVSPLGEIRWAND